MTQDQSEANRPATLNALGPGELYRSCDAGKLGFETTDELPDGEPWIGQERLVASIEFGMGIRGGGYHIFAMGPRNTDKLELVDAFLSRRSSDEAVPPDLCYVHNFDDPYRPHLLQLPAGMGGELSREMDTLVAEIESSLITAFESEEYQSRRSVLREATEAEHGKDFEVLQERAREGGLALLRSPAGFGFVPLKDDGEPMEDEDIEALTDEDRKKLEAHSEKLQAELQGLLRTIPARKRQIRNRLRKLDREFATFALNELFEGVRSRFAEQEQVVELLKRVQDDIVDNVQSILQAAAQRQEAQPSNPVLAGPDGEIDPGGAASANPMLANYRVNLIVDHSSTEGGPVVHEEHPTYKNLVGRIEHRSRMGVLTTDYTLIRPGALHRASGGYLILDARSVLLEPFAWEALKRVLTTGRLKIESLGQSYSPISTVTLEPEALETDVRVVLLGERRIYYMLCAHDPEFSNLFKIEADFEDEMQWDGDTDDRYARFLAGLVRARKLRPFHREAVARIIEEGARLAGDREKLSTITREIDDLLQQADHWAHRSDREVVSREDVQTAIDQQLYRASRLGDRLREQILRETILIDTSGSVVGQINGLSVMRPGKVAFGSPNRITARVGLGKGEIVDIEREVEMGGPLHSKGVLILKGFLTQLYARERPLSLRASLVFEQSYGGVDGDSASAAELFALLSAIARVPLRQDLAVTGSVNQHGRIQAIGGVNEKIEGFFDVCRERGLTGTQGVVIPRANVKHLMLRADVVEAAARGEFHIYPMESVDEGLALFSGIEAGSEGPDGSFPEESFNGRVRSALETMAVRLREFGAETGRGSGTAEDGGTHGA